MKKKSAANISLDPPTATSPTTGRQIRALELWNAVTGHIRPGAQRKARLHTPGTRASQGSSRITNTYWEAWPDLRVLFPHTGMKDSS